MWGNGKPIQSCVFEARTTSNSEPVSHDERLAQLAESTRQMGQTLAASAQGTEDRLERMRSHHSRFMRSTRLIREAYTRTESSPTNNSDPSDDAKDLMADPVPANPSCK